MALSPRCRSPVARAIEDGMSREERLLDRLRSGLAAEHVAVTDESERHVGHEGARAGGGHYTVVVVAARFAGLDQVARHRAVYGAVGDMIPGEIQVASGEIELNKGRKPVSIAVENSGDRPVQVGSHYHFFETNDALKFDRKKAYGCRLNIAAGTAVRFEPGQKRTVELIALAGDRRVYGFTGKVMGKLK